MADDSKPGAGPMGRGKRVDRRHSMAVAVLVFGILSIAMIAWMNQITRRGDSYFHLANAVMHFQINVARSYVEFHDTLRGEHGMKKKKACSDFDRTIELCEAILVGGEYGLILPSLRDPSLRGQAE